MRHLRLILTIAGNGLLELSRMPGVLAVIFLPGAVLYLIFTLVMPGGGGGNAGLPQINLAVVDRDDSAASRQLTAALGRMSVRVHTRLLDGRPIDEPTAASLVEKGHMAAGLVIPRGYSGRLFEFDQGGAPVELIVDETAPMSGDMVAGMLQMAAGMAFFEMTGDMLEGLTGRRLFGPAAPVDAETNGVGATTSGVAAGGSLLNVQTRGVAVHRGEYMPPRSLLYLVGLVPMFLLFNAAGAAGALLEQVKAGATRRILAAPVDAGDYLCGHLLVSLCMSLLQVSSMYLLAWGVFGAPIFRFAGGLAVVTVATAFATVGFGMLMASIARTPEQLGSLGTVVILAMSALGGSMFPRFFMPDWIKPLGLLTINGWAYDGLIAIIRGQGLGGAGAEVAVLAGIGAACAAGGSLLLGRRLRSSPAGG